MRIRRLAAIAAFAGMLLATGSNPAQAQDSYAGNINSCSDLGAGFVDASGLVTVTANDGTYLSYTSSVAVTAAIKGGPNYNVYGSSTSGSGLHSPLNGGGNVPAISHYLFCYVPGDEVPVDEEPACATDPSLCPVDEEPTCETDPSLCPVDEEPTCATDPTLCPVDEEPTCATDPSLCPVDEEPTCATDPSLCEEPVDEEPTDEEPGTCPGGTDGFPECNPQIDAEVNLSVDCLALNQDGSYTLGGVVSVTNQSEHAQDIRITQLTGPSPDAEAFFAGQQILNGATLSYPFQMVWFGGSDPSVAYSLSTSVVFESLQGRGTVREPRGDVEEFYLDGACAGGGPVDEEPVDEEPTCATDPSLCEVPVDEEPVDQEPVDEEPVDQEPTVEQPVDEEPVDEEPAVAEPETNGLDEEVVALPKTGSGLPTTGGSPVGLMAALAAVLVALAVAFGVRPRRAS